MREFFTRHCALPSPLMCSPESKLECNIVALNFPLHIKVPYGESLPSVIFALYQSGEFSVFTFVLFNHTQKKKKKKRNSSSVHVHFFKHCGRMITVKLFYNQ